MSDWNQFYSEERSIYVSILKQECKLEDIHQGSRTTWLTMEYAIPESEWKVVIKYTYEKSEEDKENSAAHAKAMADLKPLGHFKIAGEPGQPG